MNETLADWTTLRVGGACRHLVSAQSHADVITAVRDADDRGEPVLILGGGSNLVVSDDGFDGTVIAIRTRGVTLTDEGCGGAWVEAAAGESWDDLVDWCVQRELRGIEALSGIPGSVGATPVQNVGAYGQEIADVVSRVTVFDRVTRSERILPVGECDFSYRSSLFKAEPNRFVILSVALQMRRGDLSEPIAYAELAASLGVEVGECAPSRNVRECVLELRQRKGMVLNPDDHDTWSVGSFFVNPIVEPQRVPASAPAWPQGDGMVKTSAAWLVEQAGFPRGFALPGSHAAVSTKHSLALTNRGGATAGEVLELARVIRTGVHLAFGIELSAEPMLVGCSLD